MVAHASSARSYVALGGAAATIIAALLLHPLTPRSGVVTTGDDGVRVNARLVSSQILRGAHEQDLAVTITVPAGARQVRPPLSLAVVIDRSGSMSGEPMQNAKAAAARLVSQLDAGDAFSIITYSSGDEAVTPMLRATAANKSRAMAAIARIEDDGGTCISCGLVRGASSRVRP